MRPIEFRVWHELWKQMLYVEPAMLVADQCWQMFMARVMAGEYGDVLMQYTGLRDRNGQKIYEGDLVSWANRCYLNSSLPPNSVLFGAYQCGDEFDTWEEGVGWYHKPQTYSVGEGFGMHTAADMVVRGNIHEHPELLSWTWNPIQAKQNAAEVKENAPI